MPVGRGTLWWLHNLVPKYIPKITSIHARVDSARVFYIDIKTILIDKPSQDLNDLDRLTAMTFDEYKEAIKDAFMWWHNGDILQCKCPNENIEYGMLDLGFNLDDIHVHIIY